MKVAVLDMYNNTPNLGMGRIKHILENGHQIEGVARIEYTIFETRHKSELPDFSFDLYISTGGPGSPFDDEPWEDSYFEWLDMLWKFNEENPGDERFFFAICHSFQLMCRHFELGEVQIRKSPSFGIMPVHKVEFGFEEYLFEGLPDVFHVADFRDWQVIQPNEESLRNLNAKVLLLEKYRPYIPLERAVTGIRLSDFIIGLQFHPEADDISLLEKFGKPEEREKLVEEHGKEKYDYIIEHLKNPNSIRLTSDTVMPNLLKKVTAKRLLKEEVGV